MKKKKKDSDPLKQNLYTTEINVRTICDSSNYTNISGFLWKEKSLEWIFKTFFLLGKKRPDGSLSGKSWVTITFPFQ